MAILILHSQKPLLSIKMTETASDCNPVKVYVHLCTSEQTADY